ncbi:MAG: hypothetical protein ACLQNE_05655 [Thermoguttaceae bacterium]
MEPRLTAIVQRHEGLIWELPGREPAISDRFGCRLFRLPSGSRVGDAAQLQETEKRLQEFFAHAKNDVSEPQPCFDVHLLREDFGSGSCYDAAARLGDSLCEYRVHVVVHFSESGSDWKGMLDWTSALWDALGARAQDVWVSLEGPFAHLAEEVKSALFERGVQVRYSYGICNGRAGTACGGAEDVRDLAEFGLLVPATYYVTEENCQAAEGWIESGLEANYWSGFSLPVACQHPCYDRGDFRRVPLPTPSAYVSLLVEMLKRHRGYDPTFEPLWELNTIVAAGGWNERLAVPCHIALTMRAGRPIGVFRQVPAQARAWKDPIAATSTPADQLRAELLAFCASELAPEANPACAGCSLRFMCGGMDRWDDARAGEETAGARDLICSSRQFFLELFLWERLKLEDLTLRKAAEVAKAGVSS